MPDFLTDDWFAALRGKAADATPPTELTFSIEQHIDDLDTRWQVQITGGRVTIDRDPTVDPDVRIVTDEATARGIQAGTTSAQRAFLDGRLRIGGDVQALMTHREALAELGLGLA